MSLKECVNPGGVKHSFELQSISATREQDVANEAESKLRWRSSSIESGNGSRDMSGGHWEEVSMETLLIGAVLNKIAAMGMPRDLVE